MYKNKKAAMEMSVGTIVTIVLLMTVLILGLVLVRTIFTAGIRSVNQIDDKVRSAIDNMFLEDRDLRMVIYPSDYKIKIKQGTQGEGFAFSVRNAYLEEEKFKYDIFVDERFEINKKCNRNHREVEEWLDIRSGSFILPGSSQMERPELVLFTIPETAPTCTIPFIVKVTSTREGGTYSYAKVYLSVLKK